MHVVHEVGHAVFCLAQLMLDLIQISSNVVRSMLLYCERDLFDVDGDWNGFNEGREVPMWCGGWDGGWWLVGGRLYSLEGRAGYLVLGDGSRES
jgi:hypothetical protein